jgi:hypothetical protein
VSFGEQLCHSAQCLGVHHIVVGVRVRFPLKAECSTLVCTRHTLLIRSSVCGHISFCGILATVNKVAVNMATQIPFSRPCAHAFGNIPRYGPAGPRGDFMFCILRNCHTVFHRGCPVHNTVSHAQGFNFITTLTTLCKSVLFWFCFSW